MARVSHLLKPLVAPLFGCFWLPLFSLWAALQNCGESANKCHPLSAVQRNGRIIAASEDAVRHGLQIGWTTGRALSLLPDCLVLPFNAAHEKNAWHRVLERLYELTPKIESARPGLAWCEVHFSSLSARADTLKKRWLQLVQEFGAQLGLAHDRATAMLAAFTASDARPIRRIAAGNEAAFVANTPLEMLEQGGVSGETIQRLKWFGVHRVGGLKGWTPAHLQSQFPDAKALGHLVEAGSARADRRPVTTWRPPPTAAQSPEQWANALTETLHVLESELNGRGALHLSVAAEVRGKAKATAAKMLRERIGTAARLHEPACSMLRALLADGDELEAFAIRLSDLGDEWWQDSLFATQEKRTRALKDALRQLETRLPGAVAKLQARDVFSALPEERFEMVPFDAETLTVPALDRVLMGCGEEPRLAANRAHKPKRRTPKGRSHE